MMTANDTRIHSPNPGVYLVYKPPKPPVEGIAIYEYEHFWVCEAHNRGYRKDDIKIWPHRMTGCAHIQAVIKWKGGIA